MLILVSKALPSIQQHGGPNVGRLVTPRNWSALDETDRSLPWAADNDAFSGFNPEAYERMIHMIARRRRHLLLFVTAPDVVGDWRATWVNFWQWAPELSTKGLPIAYVIQDGQPSNDIPWNYLDAIFIGGTTEYKLSDDAAHIASIANTQHLWVHMGRVNTRRRIEHAKAIGCHSVDGTSSVRFTNTHLPWQKRHAAAPTQQRLQG